MLPYNPSRAASESASLEAPASGEVHAPLPSSAGIPSFRTSSPLTPLVCDERAIGRLLETMLDKAGLSSAEASRRLGYDSPNSVRQYLRGRRKKPSLLWFLKFAALCGAQVSIEFPTR